MMHIDRIELRDCSYSSDLGQISATLLLDTALNRFSLQATAPCNPGIGHRALLELLVKDALRQIRRMPEHRRSLSRITIAKDALPDVTFPLPETVEHRVIQR